MIDSGFAASAQTFTDMSIFEREPKTVFQASNEAENAEGYWNDGRRALVISQSGARGVVNLSQDSVVCTETKEYVQSRTIIIRADPNT